MIVFVGNIKYGIKKLSILSHYKRIYYVLNIIESTETLIIE